MPTYLSIYPRYQSIFLLPDCSPSTRFPSLSDFFHPSFRGLLRSAACDPRPAACTAVRSGTMSHWFAFVQGFPSSASAGFGTNKVPCLVTRFLCSCVFTAPITRAAQEQRLQARPAGTLAAAICLSLASAARPLCEAIAILRRPAHFPAYTTSRPAEPPKPTPQGRVRAEPRSPR